MSFKTIVEWATGDPPAAGWYNTLIINNKGIPEVMTMKWTNEDKWDNPSWEVKGWCPFPLVCEFMGEDHEPTSENPESTPEPTSEDRIVRITEELLTTFKKYPTLDDSKVISCVRDIVIAHIYYGGTHADK